MLKQLNTSLVFNQLKSMSFGENIHTDPCLAGKILAVKMVRDNILTQSRQGCFFKKAVYKSPDNYLDRLNVLKKINDSKRIEKIRLGFKSTIRDLFGDLDNVKIKTQLSDFIDDTFEDNITSKLKVFNVLGLNIDFKENINKPHELIEQMKMFGYSPNEEGVCAGLSYMAAQAVLRGDGSSFSERIELLENYDLTTLVAHIPERDENQAQAKLTKIKNDVLSFFDETSIYCGPSSVNDAFKALLPDFRQGINNIERIEQGIQVLESDELIFPNKKYCFQHVFTKEELNKLLLDIKKENKGERFSLLLSYHDHTTQIGFDGKKWLIVNHDEVIYCDELSLSKFIKVICENSEQLDTGELIYTARLTLVSNNAANITMPNLPPISYLLDRLTERKLYYLLTLCVYFYFDNRDYPEQIIKKLKEKYKVNEEDLFTCKDLKGDPVLYTAMVFDDISITQLFMDEIFSSTLNNEEIISLLDSRNHTDCSGLSKAIRLGNNDVICAYMNSILNSNLLEAEKIKLVTGTSRDDELIPALHIVMEANNQEQTELFIDAILNLNLTPTELSRLLQAKNEEKSPALYEAMRKNNAEAIRAFIDKVLSARLLNRDLFELLTAKNSQGMSGLEIAIKEDCNSALSAYLEAILASHLKAEDKLAILNIKNLLFKLVLNENTAVIKSFVDLILNANLSYPTKEALLNEPDIYGDPFFYYAMKEGEFELADIYIKSVLNSNLSPTQKMKLIQSKNNQGKTPLAAAIENKQTKISEHFIRLINASNLFSTAQKVSLTSICYTQNN